MQRAVLAMPCLPGGAVERDTGPVLRDDHHPGAGQPLQRHDACRSRAGQCISVFCLFILCLNLHHSSAASVDTAQAEEPSVVEEMVRPLLEAAQRDSPRGIVIVSSLLQVTC